MSEVLTLAHTDSFGGAQQHAPLHKQPKDHYLFSRGGGVQDETCYSSKFFNRGLFSHDSQLRGIAQGFYKISALGLPASWPDKKENKIFLIYKEIQNGAVAKVIYD